MKNDSHRLSLWLLSALLSIMTAFSAVMCLQDCFSIPCRPTVLFAVCCCAALAFSGVMQLKRLWIAALLAVVLFSAGVYWQHMELFAQLQSAAHAVSGCFALCFPNVIVIGSPGTDCTLLLALLQLPLVWLTAWVISREGSCIPVLLVCGIFLAASVIIVDLAPNLWMVALTAAILVMLLTNHVRERNPGEGGILAWWILLPTAILIFALTAIWPPASYTRPVWTESLRHEAETRLRIDTFYSEVKSRLPQWDSQLDDVDLSRLGPKILTGQPVLQFRATMPISYLRGGSLQVYDGTSWSAGDSAAYAQENFRRTPLIPVTRTNAETVEIETVRQERLLYTPYFLTSAPIGGTAMEDAYFQNTNNQSKYTCDYLLRQWYDAVHHLPENYDRYVREHYLQIPDSIQAPLRAIAEEMALTADPDSIAAAVRSHGTYDLNTPRMPEGKDFVLYFLQESRRGYCVHFSSAAVMLLRTMGIPARYVTGYAVESGTGQWNSVTDDDSHAWAEYYVDGIGWIPLDATPAAGLPYTVTIPEGPGTSQTAPDTAVQTFAPSEPDTPEQENVPPAPDEDVSSSSAAKPSAVSKTPYPALWLFSLLPVAVLLLVLRRTVIMYRMQRRSRRGRPNQRLLIWWRQLIRLAKIDGYPIEDALIQLAEKARFSQHQVEEAEIRRMAQEVQLRKEQLHAADRLSKRLWRKLITLLY